MRLHRRVLPFALAQILVVSCSSFNGTVSANAAGLSVEPSSLSFGSVTVNTASSASTVTFTNSGRQSLRVVQVVSNLPEFTVTGPSLPATLAVGNSLTFQVTFRPDSAKTFLGNLTFTLSRVSGWSGVRTVAVTGAGISSSTPPSTSPQISVSPTSASFSVNVGSSQSQPVTITSIGTATLSITQANLSGSGFSISGLTLPLNLSPGQSSSFSVKFAPTVAGSVAGNVSLANNAAGSPTQIALAATGLVPASPQIRVSPTSASFAVNVGSSQSQSVTITSTGTATLSITQANVSGSGFSISGLTLPLNLSPGQISSFSVKFAPTVAGTVNGAISLVSNASGSSTPVSLTGNAVQPPPPGDVTGVTISPTNPSVQAGQSIQFSDTVEGTTTDTSVNWTTSAGSITTGGLFTAPSSVGTATVTATSNADPSKSASATVTVASEPQFYVSTTGNDSNNGTSSSSAWKTIQHAMNNAAAGSTVNIMAGTYQERLTSNVSGTSGNYITFQPYNFSVPVGGCGGYTGVPCGGDQVILDYSYLGTVSDCVPLINTNGKSYVIIQGLTLQNFTTLESGCGPNYGIHVNGSRNINVQYCTLQAFTETGTVGSAYQHSFWIDNSSSSVTVFANTMKAIHNHDALPQATSSSGITISYNWLYDVDQIGIDMWNNATNYTVAHNKLEYISVNPSNGTCYYSNCSVAMYNDGGNNGVWDGNWCNHCGVGIEDLAEPGNSAAHDIIVRNNVVLNSPQSGIVLGTWYSSQGASSVYNINVWNNTFYNNSPNVQIPSIGVQPFTAASMTWENNIFYGSNNYANAGSWATGTTGYNDYAGGGGTGPGSNNLTSNPLFVSTTSGNFSLQSSSPAINAGDPNSQTTIIGTSDFAGNPRIQGGRIDIGAYEVQ